MGLLARAMRLEETTLIVDYFHSSTPEHLELLGVDPSRLPSKEAWMASLKAQYELPLHSRRSFFVVWLSDDCPVGFSSCDKIEFGKQAYMHLHVIDMLRRQQGVGAECVRQSVPIYFRELEIQLLFCEPNAFNVAPNRTLQHVGFKYIKTHKTVPGPLNFHQAVNRWQLERSDISRLGSLPSKSE